MTEMELFDKSNFRSEQHAQWQDMFNHVNDSMAICHATIVPPPIVQDFLHSITALTECPTNPMEHMDTVYNHPQGLTTIHVSIPQREDLMADQEMFSPRLPVSRLPLDQPAISKMICTFPDCVAQGDSGATEPSQMTILC